MKTLFFLFSFIFCSAINYTQTVDDVLAKAMTDRILGQWKTTINGQKATFVFLKENKGMYLVQDKVILFVYTINCADGINRIDLKDLKTRDTDHGAFIFKKDNLLISVGSRNFDPDKANKFVRTSGIKLDKWEDYMDREENMSVIKTPESANRDGVNADLNNFGAMGQQYFRKPISYGGGENSFVGWEIPNGLENTPNGTYEIKLVEENRLILIGTGNEIGKDKSNKLQIQAEITPSNIKLSEIN